MKEYIISIPCVVNATLMNYEPEIVVIEEKNIYEIVNNSVLKNSTRKIMSKIIDFEGNEIENVNFSNYENRYIDYSYLIPQLFIKYKYSIEQLILKPNLFLDEFDKNSLIPFNDFDLAKIAKINLLKQYENKFDFIKEIIKKYEHFEDKIAHKLI
jgi:hypothetical protein